MKKHTSFGEAITSYIPEIVKLLVTALIVALADIFLQTDANANLITMMVRKRIL
jgi:hypothetical protein